MKSRAVAVFATLSMLIAPLSAQAKPTEIELHIEASAQVPPDRAIITVVVKGIGDDLPAAQADLAKNEAELMADLAKAGVDRAQIKPANPDANGQGQIDFNDSADAAAGAACAATDTAMDAAAEPKNGAKPRKARVVRSTCDLPQSVTVKKTLVVEISDVKLLAELATTATVDYSYGRRPVYFQNDPVAARKKARNEAIIKARTEAEAYAEALGYKVIRITRVSNARPSINLQDVVTFITGIDDRSNRLQPSWFATTIVESVAIDFVIVPK